MNKNQWISVAAVFLVISSIAWSADQSLSPNEIMKRNEEARRLSDTTADGTLTTRSGNTERVKKFTWWRKLTSDGVHYNTLTRFHLPAEIRGEGVLFLERSADDNEVLMYLPAYKKIRRVETQQQSGSFMGSAFSYADIATPHVNDYRYKQLKEEACPGTPGVICAVIESTPATDAVKERTGTTRSVSWIRKDNFMAERIDSYDGETMYKQLSASQIREVDTTRHKWMAFHLEMKNLKTNYFTSLQFENVKVNQGIPDSTFTQQRLSNPR